MNEENDDEKQGGIAKWIPTIVLFVVVSVFVSLAWYSYHVGKESVKEDDLLVVEADSAPVKEKPLDPGGMKIPNQDKTIFETFSSNKPPAQVERVLPPPEEPITSKAELEETIGHNTNKQAVEVAHATTRETEKEQIKSLKFETAPKPEPAKPTEVKAVEVKSVEVKSVEHKTDTVKTTEEKPLEKKHSEPAKTGAVKIQLGAYGSDSEARGVWAKLQKKIPALSSRSPIIVRADVQGKGVFYRLRVGGFASKDDAKKFCKNLSDSGQACILASD